MTDAEAGKVLAQFVELTENVESGLTGSDVIGVQVVLFISDVQTSFTWNGESFVRDSK